MQPFLWIRTSLKIEPVPHELLEKIQYVFPDELREIALDEADAAFYQHEDIVITKYKGIRGKSRGKAYQVVSSLQSTGQL